MKKLYTAVVKGRKKIVLLFLVAVVFCGILMPMVSVNYDINDYLPEDVSSTQAIDLMETEFEGGIPNARVMIKNVSIPEALEYKKQLEKVKGVMEVTWLDDAVDITVPEDTIDEQTKKISVKESKLSQNRELDTKRRLT